jgi:hypothetical protein
MKRLIHLIILVKISSSIWINPQHVIYVDGQIKGICDGDMKTTIGIDSAEMQICSDWSPAKVREALEQATKEKK